MDLSVSNFISAIAGAFITGCFSYLIRRYLEPREVRHLNISLDQVTRDLKDEKDKAESLSKGLSAQAEELASLRDIQKKYNFVRDRLKHSSVVRNYEQPVLLVGPRGVGKSSLLMQLHAPWNHSEQEPSHAPLSLAVPVYDFKLPTLQVHFADSEIATDCHVHLKLKVHDFPGELSAQKSIINQARVESDRLRKETGKDLGIVLICMLDASEAALGIAHDTRDYYNGDLFAQLKDLLGHRYVHMERLILVFNKYDKLREHVKEEDDAQLMAMCKKNFDPTLNFLHGVCNPERICSVFTVLSRGREMFHKNRGAPIVLGEASRRFIEELAGREVAEKVRERYVHEYARQTF